MSNHVAIAIVVVKMDPEKWFPQNQFLTPWNTFDQTVPEIFWTPPGSNLVGMYGPQKLASPWWEIWIDHPELKHLDVTTIWTWYTMAKSPIKQQYKATVHFVNTGNRVYRNTKWYRSVQSLLCIRSPGISGFFPLHFLTTGSVCIFDCSNKCGFRLGQLLEACFLTALFFSCIVYFSNSWRFLFHFADTLHAAIAAILSVIAETSSCVHVWRAA